jgi:hypothetical protein
MEQTSAHSRALVQGPATCVPHSLAGSSGVTERYGQTSPPRVESAIASSPWAADECPAAATSDLKRMRASEAVEAACRGRAHPYVALVSEGEIAFGAGRVLAQHR